VLRLSHRRAEFGDGDEDVVDVDVPCRRVAVRAGRNLGD